MSTLLAANQTANQTTSGIEKILPPKNIIEAIFLGAGYDQSCAKLWGIRLAGEKMSKQAIISSFYYMRDGWQTNIKCSHWQPLAESIHAHAT